MEVRKELTIIAGIKEGRKVRLKKKESKQQEERR